MELNARLNLFERTVTSADGTRLHVAGCGDPVHPPLLLLHGGGQTSWSWRRSAVELAKAGWCCLMPDLRGHGTSGYAERYELDHFAADVADLISQLCDQPPVLVGASLGGISGLIAEADHSLLRALILVDIVPDWEQNGIEQIMAFFSAHPEGFDTVEQAAQSVSDYLPHRTSPPDAEGLKKNLRQRNNRWYWHWDPALLEAASGHIAQWPEKVRGACDRINVPTLLISGENSEVVSADGADRLLQRITHAQHVVIEKAHHMVAGDSNQPFTQAVLDFVQTLPELHQPQEDSLCLVS